MNRRYIEDNHVVDRYLLGQLTEQELFEFESYYFEHPQMLEELNIAQAMHNTVREESISLQATQTKTTKLNWFSWLLQPQISFALSAVLAVGVLSLWLENTQLQSSQSAVFPVSSLILSQSRGASSAIDEVRIAQSQSALAIRLIMGPIGYPEVGVQIKNSIGDVLWQGQSTIDGPVGAVNLVVMSQLLAPGEYTLSVLSPTNSLNVLSMHRFKVVQN